MASVLARASVGAKDALQKMLESKRIAVLEQQRANEVRQQQQDLKAYRSQTIQEGQARIQQQRDAADDLAQYRKDSLIQTEVLAGQARDHAATLAEERRIFEAEQNKLDIAGRISERELIEKGLNSRNELDYVQQMILENTYTDPSSGEVTRNFNQVDMDRWIHEAKTIGKGYERTPDTTTTEVPFYLRPQGQGIPSAISDDILGDSDIEMLEGELPPPRPLSPTGRFNTRREEPYQPSPELMGLPSATGPSVFEPLPIPPRPLSPTGGFNVRREAPFQPSLPAGQPSPVQADPFGGLTQEAALQQIAGLTQAQTQEPQQKLFEAPKWQPSPGVITPTPARPSHRIGTPSYRRTPPVSEAAQGGVGAAFRVSEARQKRIDELLEWEADLLSGKRSGFAPGHKTSQESFNLWINAPLPGRGPKETRERDKLRREYALQAVRRELNDLGAKALTDAELMPTPFDMNALIPTVPFEAPLYPSVETTGQAYDPATGKPIPGF